MKKTFSILVCAILLIGETFAGGIMTNTNQSVSFVRNPARGASLDLDAVYFNPAGVGFLSNGFHLSLNSQTILQNRTIITDMANLNVNEFNGKATAPIFPSVFAVYKMDKWAFSFGFNPIGGGGVAKFDEGLPSFERGIAGITQALTFAGIPTSQYSYDVSFEGSSLFLGFQGAVTYKVSDAFSVSAGARYVSAKNTYTGYLRDIMINPMHPLNPAGMGNMVAAPTFFTGLATAANGAASSLQPIIDNEVGGLTLDQLVAHELMTQTQADQLIAGLGGLYNATMTASQIQLTYQGMGDMFSNNAADTADKEVDVSQTGSGFAPLIGFTLRPTEGLVIGLKYEHKTPLVVKNKTIVDGTGMFPDGKEVHNDMPSLLSLGVSYQVSPALKLSGTGYFYLDRDANYGKEIGGVAVDNKQVIDKNSWEAAFGAEYQLSSELMLSVGYMRTNIGVNEKYQSDLSHSLSANTIAGGFRYNFSPGTAINLGVMNIWYMDDTTVFTNYSDTYKRSAFVLGFGVDFSL